MKLPGSPEPPDYLDERIVYELSHGDEHDGIPCITEPGETQRRQDENLERRCGELFDAIRGHKRKKKHPGLDAGRGSSAA